MAEVTAADVARQIDVPPATLRRWVRSGLFVARQAAVGPGEAVTRQEASR